jgi:hypothetical protein
MEKFSEQKIEQILQTLAEIQPGEESANRMQETVRKRITDRCRSEDQPFLQRHNRLLSALAAVILIAIGLLMLFQPAPPIQPPAHPETPGPSVLSPTSLVSLNKAFEKGGMEAVDKLFTEFMKLKKPVPQIKSVDDATNGQSEKEK